MELEILVPAGCLLYQLYHLHEKMVQGEAPPGGNHI